MANLHLITHFIAGAVTENEQCDADKGQEQMRGWTMRRVQAEETEEEVEQR